MCTSAVWTNRSEGTEGTKDCRTFLLNNALALCVLVVSVCHHMRKEHTSIELIAHIIINFYWLWTCCFLILLRFYCIVLFWYICHIARRKSERQTETEPPTWVSCWWLCLGHIRIMQQLGQILSVLNRLPQSSSQHDSGHVPQEVENPA